VDVQRIILGLEAFGLAAQLWRFLLVFGDLGRQSRLFAGEGRNDPRLGKGRLVDVLFGAGRLIFAPAVDRVGLSLVHRLDDVAVLDLAKPHEDRQHHHGERHHAVEPLVLGFGVDITEQVRAEGRLRTLTRQSDSILESVGDGIFCIDLEGQVTVVNAAAAQMLGYKQDEMLGRVMHNLIHHTKPDGASYPSEESPIRKSLSNFGTARVVDEVFWRKDGTSFPVEYVARPLIDTYSGEGGEARAVGVVVAFTDTTERRALDRMKDEFISTVSHELRTPLTSLRGALGLLAGGALDSRPEKSSQMLEIAINNTDRLVRLVNDILDLERISSGKSELHSTTVGAEELLRKAVSAQQARTPKPSARIFFAANGVTVWADPERILQALNNLLSNAIKFSPQGAEIHLSARNLDDQEALFEVRDQGRGIPEEKLEHIFDRFQQGDASDTRTLGGTGLGLAICRSIINQHGGRIWATSTTGHGTTFHFTLPTKPRTNLR